MGTVKDYFESDSRDMSVRNSLSIFSPQGVEIGHTIECKVSLLIDAHSKYISIYSAKEVDYRALLKHLENPIIRECDIPALLGQSKEFEMDISVNGGDIVSPMNLVFSKKSIIYVDSKLSEQKKYTLKQHGTHLGLNVEIRDESYAEERSRKERPLAFISHAKSDGRDFAIELANRLSVLGCPVWFDEFSLKIGDSLVESIDLGLKNSDKCIFVLTPDFLKNEAWCKHEFKSAMMKQVFEKKNIILPVWHGVEQKDVYNYNAILTETLGASSSQGSEIVAKQISKVLLE